MKSGVKRLRKIFSANLRCVSLVPFLRSLHRSTAQPHTLLRILCTETYTNIERRSETRACDKQKTDSYRFMCFT